MRIHSWKKKEGKETKYSDWNFNWSSYWSSMLFSVITHAENVEGMNIWKDWEYDPGPWCARERTNSFVRTCHGIL